MNTFKNGNNLLLPVFFISILLVTLGFLTHNAFATDSPPASPQNLQATIVSPLEISLSWNTPTDNGGPAISGYQIERSTDSGATWSAIAPNTGNTDTTYVDSGLASGTTYTYQVSAINSIGTSSPSNTASATTSSISIGAQFWACCYGLLKMTGSAHNQVPGDNNQVHVQFYAPNGQLILDDTHTLCSSCVYFEDSTGISRDQGKGDYTIVATYDNELVAKTEVPSWINNNSVSLTASETSDGSVSIGNRVYTGISGEQDSLTILDPNNSTTAVYTIGTGIQGQLSLMIYSTQQACAADRGDPSSCPGPFTSTAFPTSGNYTIVLTYPTGDIAGKTMLTYISKIPSPPTGLTATAQLLKINLGWMTPSYDGGTPIIGYMIERSTDSGNTWSQLVSNTGSTGTTYSDTHVLPLKTYTYRVSAINSAGTSPPSNTSSASIVSKPTIP